MKPRLLETPGATQNTAFAGVLSRSARAIQLESAAAIARWRKLFASAGEGRLLAALLLLFAAASAFALAPLLAVREPIEDSLPSQPYRADVPDVQYHAPAGDIAAGETPAAGPTVWSAMSVSPPAAYVPAAGGASGAPNFVPNYEESVYLSRTSGQSQVAQFAAAPPPTDFCAAAAGSRRKTEAGCAALGAAACAATDCCVLLGGRKCVAGGQTGPLLAENYLDPAVARKDAYYHRGVCYGNCAGAGEAAAFGGFSPEPAAL